MIIFPAPYFLAVCHFFGSSFFIYGCFLLDYFSVDWEDWLKIDELNVDNSTKIYSDKINMLLDTYAPLKKIKISTS